MVMEWITLLPHSKKVPGLFSGSTKSAFPCRVCMFSPCMGGFPLVSSHSLTTYELGQLGAIIAYRYEWLSLC